MAHPNNETRYDRIMTWAKERWISTIILVLFMMIVGLGTLTDSIDKILTFSGKYTKSNSAPMPVIEMHEAPQPYNPNYEQFRPVSTNSLNPDYKKRDEILNVSIDWAETPNVTVDFEELSVVGFEKLIKSNYIDLDDKQNNAPTAREFYEYLMQHPEYTVAGYAVGPFRSDYRITITALESPQDGLTPYMVERFLDFCTGADEINSYFVCWWD